MMRTRYETAQGLLLESADCCRPNPDTLIPLFSASRDASWLCALQNRGYSSNYGKSRLAWDCVVADAVSCELVSPAKFPDNRENTGNLAGFRLPFGFSEPFSGSRSKAYG